MTRPLSAGVHPNPDMISGQTSPPQGEQFVAISSASNHTCALRRDGSAVCWGAQQGDMGDYGHQVGFGQAEPPAGETFVAISSGDLHTCALRSDGSPVCWGKGFPEAN